MKNENLFRIFYNRAYDYFTANFLRRVFFFALCSVVFFAIVIRFLPSQFAYCAILLSCTVCTGVSFIDSIGSKRDFLLQMKNIEYDYIKRVFDKHGEDGLATMQGAFSFEELRFMRKKKREFNYTITVKFFFTVIFVVLFCNML